MSQQSSQQLTPEQQNQIRKAKQTLWIGITFIIVIGLAVAVYFVFLKSEEQGNLNTNAVINTNTPTSIDTINWQTYEDEINGYFVKYPAGLFSKNAS